MEQERPCGERRRYIRLNTSVEVKYTVIGKPGTIRVFSKNISAGGICIIIEEKLEKDTPLQLEIVIPDLKEPIRALGRVVWQRRVEPADEQSRTYLDTGIEFTGISNFDLFNINRYVLENVDTREQDKG